MLSHTNFQSEESDGEQQLSFRSCRGLAVLRGLFSQCPKNSAQHLAGPVQDNTTTSQEDETTQIEWSVIVELPGLQNGVGHVIWIVRDCNACACGVTPVMVRAGRLTKHNDIRGMRDTVHRINILDPARWSVLARLGTTTQGDFPLRGGPVDTGPGVLQTCPAVVYRVDAGAEEHEKDKPKEYQRRVGMIPHKLMNAFHSFIQPYPQGHQPVPFKQSEFIPQANRD